jgi:hypothetical protein
MTHDVLVGLITAAGVDLPPKPPEQMPPYRRRRGPEAATVEREDRYVSGLLSVILSADSAWQGYRRVDRPCCCLHSLEKPCCAIALT